MKKLFAGLAFLFAIAVSAQNPPGGYGPGGGGTSSGGVNTQSGPGPVFNAKGYGAVGDTQHIVDGSTTGTGARNTVTSATAHFQTRAKVGQNIVCAAAGNSTPLMPISQITAITSDTVVTTNGTDNGTASSLRCIWYTQDDTSAFQAAVTAATPSPASANPGIGTTYGTPGQVFCPSGGYAVKGRIFSFVGTGSTIGPSFRGDPGKNHCIIYMIPGLPDPADGFPVLVSFYNGTGFDMEDIVIEGLGFGGAFSHPVVGVLNAQQFSIKRVNITNTAVSGANNGTFDFSGASNGTTEDVFVQGGGSGTDFACSFHGGSNNILNRNLTCSNHAQNILVDGNSATPRSIAGDNGITFIGGIADECSVTGACFVVSNGGVANVHDFSFMVGNANLYAMSVDGTSRAYLNNVSCGVFGSTTVTANCMNLSSGAYVAVSFSDLRGNDSSSTAGTAVNGPAGATFVDLGGNKILHSVSAVISAVTPAQYGTLGFTGGIVPKSTQTHTPNTCYAAGGNLLATLQNLCTILLDQNYQLLNITAGQTGTAVTTSCTGAPVVTLSDGTRSATLTLTTANTSWSSTGLSTVFASGATLTVSVGANTCATPPTGLYVNYVLQSVLNP